MATTLAERLEQGLDEIITVMDGLLGVSTIDYVPDRAVREMHRSGLMIAAMADGEWGPANEAQEQHQRKLRELWKPWIEQVRLLFSNDTPETKRVVKEAAAGLSGWIDRNSHKHEIPPTIDEAKQVFRRMAQPLRSALKSVGSGSGSVIAIPDTNVLIRTPDVTTYGSVLGVSKYTVFFVPGVLGELDKHKVSHSNQAVREKARKVSNRIKGWRNQGDLAKGVRVQGDVWARVEGKEPDFSNTLSWLQPEVVDDRIVATILEVQRQRPGDRVVLLTGDTLMLAKADAASIPTADTPDPDP